MITQEDIEKARTPMELRQYVALTRQKIKADQTELSKARRKNGLYKVFVDEVMPLAQAADHLCEPEDRLKPVLGNQGYDVIILGPTGSLKGKIEIAKPYNGKSDAIDAHLIDKQGYGQFKVHDLGAELDKVATLILDVAKAKSLKDYSDCILLIVGVIPPPFDCEIEGLEQAAALLCDELKQITYIANRVVLVLPTLKKCYLIQA